MRDELTRISPADTRIHRSTSLASFTDHSARGDVTGMRDELTRISPADTRIHRSTSLASFIALYCT